MPVKISKLEIENVKRVRAVALEPSAAGLTVIGGRNGQGKTSVLDAICWALGGEKFRPSKPWREGSVIPPEIHVELSNGITVERKGKSGALKVSDPSGQRSGQQLLNTFVEQLALNLPKFMEASDKEKANTLLQIIGVGDQLAALEAEENRLYNERTVVGRMGDQKRKYADELPHWDGVPADIVTPTELIQRQQEILARNAQRQQWIRDYERICQQRDAVDDQIKLAEERLRTLRATAAELEKQAVAAQKSPAELQMESTTELEADLARIDITNAKIRDNLSREKAREDAQQYADQYTALTEQLEAVRARKTSLLDGAALPLPGLGITDGALTYNGHPWDGMSGSEQLRVATAIVRRLNPDCGFVLMDKLEQMDADTLREFGQWLEGEGLQVIATRVSTGDECSIIISDGEAIMPEHKTPPWKAGEF